MSRVVVVGAAGMLGRAVVDAVRRRGHEVIRAGRDRAAGWLSFDAERDSPGDLIAPRPTTIVNCAGVLASEIDPADPGSVARAERVNARFPQALATEAETQGIRIVHISTDAVFRDDAGRCFEGDERFTADVYGVTKLRGEPAGDHALTLRCSFVGRDPKRQRGLVEWLLGTGGGEVPGFVDQVWNGLVANQIASVCAELCGDDLFEQARAESAVHHLFEDPPVTRHELVTLIAGAFGMPLLVVPVDSGRPITRLLGTRHAVLREYLESLPSRAASLEALARGEGDAHA